MDRVLIVSSGDKATGAIVNLIKDSYPNCAQSVVNTGNEARRVIADTLYDLVIINCPLSDEFGNELAEYITSSTSASCVMIVRSENSDAIGDRMADFGVMVLAKPINRQAMYGLLRIAKATHKRMMGVAQENVKLHKRLEEMRVINRAKFALMQYLGFTETQAHRYLEKQAMDMRCTKLEVALNVIKTYEQ
ncbi:MAG: ANTAR domain-containing protein [Ruminococcus sp.]|nr:ANTAR domain-containing protein [Ruminococcus sp.]